MEGKGRYILGTGKNNQSTRQRAAAFHGRQVLSNTNSGPGTFLPCLWMILVAWIISDSSARPKRFDKTLGQLHDQAVLQTSVKHTARA